MKETNQPMSKRAIVKLVTKKLGKGYRTTLRQEMIYGAETSRDKRNNVHADVDTDVWVDTERKCVRGEHDD